MLAFIVAGCQTHTQKEINLIPQPTELIVKDGTFTLDANTRIVYNKKELAEAAGYLQKAVKKQTGHSLALDETATTGNNIFMTINPDLGSKDKYTLAIDGNEIRLAGSNPRAVVQGIQTIRQFLPPIDNGTMRVLLPAVSITDEPAWEWRGMMMDVARHFFDKEEVKRFLDMMAIYKFNKFHWHLTDDQGWRVEIKKYPLLTEQGGWRTFNKHDRTCMALAKEEDNPDYELPQKRLRNENDTIEYGGFYTQEDIREIIAYAAERGIDVIPEIDMPGHFSSAIQVYPELSCFNRTSWGELFSAPICPGKDHTISFCKDIFTEIFELFPYEYVHMGADEVDMDNWIKCPHCQARIRKEKLKNEKELHSWFVREMKGFFEENGKKLIGWDEIIDGGLPEGAVVMWWRTWSKDAVHTATAKGSEVILTPNSHNYFDYKQDYSTLRKLYEFDPVPAGLTAEQKTFVKGVQANCWAEYIPSYQRLEYLIMPRMFALSEVAWRGENREDWGNFYQRMIPHFSRLDSMEVNYRPLDLPDLHTVSAFIGSTQVVWNHPLPEVSIHYTTDGTMPTRESKRYEEPFTLSETTDFILRFYRPNGTASGIEKTTYRKEEYQAGSNLSFTEKGLKCVWHEGIFSKCNEIESVPAIETYHVEHILIPEGVGGKRGLVYTGFIKVDKDDIYTFILGSDDGSMLYINDDRVVDNDGAHGPVTLSGQKALSAGYHEIKLYYFDRNNGGFIDLELQDSEGNNIELSGERLWSPDSSK